jgi:hypothetical protein
LMYMLVGCRVEHSSKWRLAVVKLGAPKVARRLF